jgi:predicted small lipoprotein YifL
MKTLFVLVALVALAACQKGPAEKAGRQIDDAGKAASRSIEKAGESVRDAANGKK